MDVMIKSVVTLTFTALLAGSLSAHAANVERVSAKEWAQKWAATLKTPKALAYSTQEVEKKTLGACFDCDNKDALKKGRAEFAAGKYEQAISSYNKIPRANTYWLSAIEEKGWAFFRQGDFEKTLAQTKTLMAPQFAEIANS